MARIPRRHSHRERYLLFFAGAPFAGPPAAPGVFHGLGVLGRFFRVRRRLRIDPRGLAALGLAASVGVSPKADHLTEFTEDRALFFGLRRNVPALTCI
jgi:hypothetical protein